MPTVTVELGARSYPVCIGAGLLGDGALLRRLLGSGQVLVVTNGVVAEHWLEPVLHALDGTENTASLVLPDGESTKTLESMQRIVTELLTLKYGRDACLVALGGGVIGDLTGFAAACYQRGIGFVQLPTTLLAQVDSAVGGKTAVNHELGKNMIGAFHQPRGVISDIDTLRTLPPRELRAGLAEIIKYGLISDAEFFAWLENSVEDLLALRPEALLHAIARSCAIKSAVVAADEREDGLRAILNFGHTFGHALETAQNYRDWLHGEAVAVGMLMAAELSRTRGGVIAADVDRIRALLRRAGLPVQLPTGLPAASLLEAMSVDKKARAGRLRFVLLRGIGRAEISADCRADEITAAVASCGAAGGRDGR
jgi:3-dehydroquinate synthase